jgi:hypothetical protein
MKILIIRLWKLLYIYENQLIWEPGEFEKNENFDNLIGSHQPNNIYILENRSGSHNFMREPELAPFHKKSKNCPTLVQTLPPFNLLVLSSIDHISTKGANSLKVSNRDGDRAMWPHQHPVVMDHAHSLLNQRWQTLQKE